jgi:hypothetical protein
MPCPKCGAPVASEDACRELFDLSQLKEIEDPAYYAVHHLSVPTYMLQHNTYSAHGWLQVHTLLRRFLFEGLTPQQARREITEAQRRAPGGPSITRGPKLPGVEAVTWTRTIASVPLDTAERYCAAVRTWAEAVIADSEALVSTKQ